ncbi:class I SAM-dependent methyltransferase [Actinomadura scrupuli]|uniref:class I SAM-dependent methyltransferase n=1 Tax=Actinomadura scrupuli TaxID=559629 RepID=UPI003D98E01D
MTTILGNDARHWPALAVVPGSRIRATVARRLFTRAVTGLPVTVLLPGAVLGAGGPQMRIVRPGPFFARLGADGLIGFGESYMAGDWRSPDLPGLLTAFATRMATLVPPRLQRLRPLAVRRPPPADDGTIEGARRNVQRHYDLSNALFAAFLDESMTYSAALFDVDYGGGVIAGDLAAAQYRKIDRLLDLTGVGPDSRVLEIGTGWGALAVRAGARGARVRSVTLSAEQRDLARRRVAEAGLADRVAVDLCDYREATGRYDAVISIEMVEAVGARHWPAYFGALEGVLAPGGRAGLQSITMPHDRMTASRGTYTWVQKYIFPGGLIPSAQAVRESAESAGLRVADRFAFGPHYAETLRLWRRSFLAAAGEVAGLGFDDTFRRMWELYLAYSEAGFRSGYLDVQQFLLTRQGDPR